MFKIEQRPDAAGDLHACLAIRVSIEDPAALHYFYCLLTKPTLIDDYPDDEVTSDFQTTLALDGSRCLQILDKFTGILPGHPVTLRYANRNTQSSAPRQVIEFRTLHYDIDVSQEDRAEYQREMDVMLNRLIDTFNISPPSYPLQMYVVDRVKSDPGRLSSRPYMVWETGIRIILALNDPMEHTQRPIEQEPWPAANLPSAIQPTDRLRLRWNSSTISPFNTV
ncbi:unnamed protein product, partial [Mesorhabditis spiculigera]